MKVKVNNRIREYDGFFKLEKVNLQFEKNDGTLSQEVVRENFYRGDSVAALVFDAEHKLVLLVRQFRYPVYAVDKSGGWILELVAGSIKEEDDPPETLLRELDEEVHINTKKENLQFINSFYVSPGGTSERIFLYAVDINLSDYHYQYGGLEEENEDIEIVLLPYAQVYDWMRAGRFNDAKTIIALQRLSQL
jgi:ADP-ribose pyrophosphatase